MTDLTQAVLVCSPSADRRERKACEVLIQEVEKRTGIRWSCADAMPQVPCPTIVVGTRESLGALAGAADHLAEPGPEGFRLLSVPGEQPLILLVGADARGVLYGVGRLLRDLRLRPGSILLESNLAYSSTPRFPLRGHQLGYRPLNNTYDAWTPAQFDQYIRELALFGANAIEFVPPHSDDPQRTAPHMPCEPLAMLTACSRICDDYGLDVWLWYPNVGKDYATPQAVTSELAEREAVFRAMPRLDAILIPGGDPGGLDIPTLFDWSAQVARVLRTHHSRAGVWLSSQAFAAPRVWLDAFYARVALEPDWLTGIVFAPWERDSLADLRARIPARYPIRHYPDITHAFLCQYPVPHWDPAFAMIEGRECINPRPAAMKRIHNLTCKYAIGSLTYSEGVNDDVNKFVWADQDWDPAKPVVETLRDYARFFLGPDEVEVIVQGLFALERNWEGPLAANQGVEATLALWRGLEARAPASLLGNWRFEQGLLRACLDAFIRRRLLWETECEKKAWAALASAQDAGALDAAQRILDLAKTQPIAADLRQRCQKLADDLWQKIGAQLTTTRHHGQRSYRGAFLDNIDLPLNDVAWMTANFDRIRALTGDEQRPAIEKMLRRTDPGPGGYYDWFGDAASWHRVEPGLGWEHDPGFFATPCMAFWPGQKSRTWGTSLTTYYDLPVQVTYTGLDPAAGYTLRVTYVCGPWSYHVRLFAQGKTLLQDEMVVSKDNPLTLEYAIPRSLCADGRLTLTWTTRDGELGARISELWLIKC